MMVDAMIGVAIIALSLTMCLSALRLARHSGEIARQTNAAREELNRLVVVTPALPGSYAGQVQGLHTQVTVTKSVQSRIDLCQIDAEVVQEAPHKAWRMTAMRWCEATS